MRATLALNGLNLYRSCDKNSHHTLGWGLLLEIANPFSNYIFKVHNKAKCETCSKWTIKTPEWVTPGPYHIETSPLVCRANMFKINNEGTRMPPGPYHIKTSPRIYRANQWAGFYMVGTWRRSVAFIASFEHISHLVLVFLLLTFTM